MDELVRCKKSFIHVGKGIENDRFKGVCEMIEESMCSEDNGGMGVLSGGSDGEEVVIKEGRSVGG
ncbi:Rossmann-fold NAD(P)-binding domain-containing protein [Staphylococcus epidermidis]|uniref:hypothetical protein n=1 Tax=Staphylococcus epidermidis TaxID=1282 RepID=UPI0021B3C888|nr:hypothetical protein [Staphylococcus epidermidis]